MTANAKTRLADEAYAHDPTRRELRRRRIRHTKHWRDLSTRYAKRASIYRAGPVLVAAIIWLR